MNDKKTVTLFEAGAAGDANIVWNIYVEDLVPYHTEKKILNMYRTR